MYNNRQLFFMPWFYLPVTFTLGYSLYAFRLINWESSPLELHFWACLTILTALLSLLLHFPRYRNIINLGSFSEKMKQLFLPGWKFYSIVAITGAIGIIGIIKYILDYSKLFGALDLLLMVFVEDTGKLRTLSNNVESVGVQLSYFSWIAAFLISINLSAKKIRKKNIVLKMVFALYF